MQTIEQKTRTNHNENPETTEVLLFQALQIAHNLQFPPMVRIAIEFYRSGRDMYRGTRQIEYRRYGLWLGRIVIHMFQIIAIKKHIFAYRAHPSRDCYLFQTLALPKHASTDSL